MFAERVAVTLKGLFGALIPDLMLFGGIASIIYGVSLQNRAGAFIVGGILAVLLGLSAGSKKNT